MGYDLFALRLTGGGEFGFDVESPVMAGKPLKLSVKMVVRDDSGRYLLLKRSMSSAAYPGKWEFPGGKIDPGESFDEALLREVAEETGLTVSIQRVAGTAESELSKAKVVYLILEGRVESGQVRLSSEHDDYVWVDRLDLPSVDLADPFRSFARAYSGQTEEVSCTPKLER